MKSIILAAGTGSRLMPYTKNTPKSLVEINGCSMLKTQLDMFKNFDIQSFVVGGYLIDKIKEVHNNVYENKDYMNTNMIYTLFIASEQFDTDIIISYGDIMYTKQTLKAIIDSDDDLSVAIDLNWKDYWSSRFENPLDDLETLLVNNNSIKEIGNKPDSYEKIHGQFMGLLKISKNFVQTFNKVYIDCAQKGFINNKKYKKAYMTDFIQELINRSFNVKPVFIKDPWIEIDTVDDYNSKVTLDRFEKILKLNSL